MTLSLGGWKSCIIIFVITIIVVLFVTITVIKSGSGICLSVHLGSQKVLDCAQWTQCSSVGAQTLHWVSLSRKALGKEW